MTVQDALDALAQDREHGASEITQRALDAYARLAQEQEDPVQAIVDAAASLIQAHPAMAPLLNATDQTLRALDKDGPQGVHKVQAKRREEQRRLVENVASHIPHQAAIATYSRSGTVLHALEHAHEQGTRFRVILSEARPGNEGLSVAERLSRDDLPVTLTYDAALPLVASSAEMLIVGADALCQAGIVNKAGTQALAREVKRSGTQAVAAAGLEKILPAAGLEKILPASYRKRPPLTTRGRLEHPLPENVHEAAPLFECASLDTFDAILTEQGSLTPDEVRERTRDASLSGALQEALSRS